MKMLRRIWPLRLVFLLIALALATSGFAHRFVTPAEQSAIAFATAYGLDASDICGSEDGDQATRGCDACLLHAAMALPEPAIAAVLIELRLDPADWVAQPPLLPSLMAEAARPVRAPLLV